jgi:hypothetical protein
MNNGGVLAQQPSDVGVVFGVFGATERQPDEAGRRGEHEAAATEPEQVICSCRVHGVRHERPAVDKNHPALPRYRQP